MEARWSGRAVHDSGSGGFGRWGPPALAAHLCCATDKRAKLEESSGLGAIRNWAVGFKEWIRCC